MNTSTFEVYGGKKTGGRYLIGLCATIEKARELRDDYDSTLHNPRCFIVFCDSETGQATFVD